MNGGNGTIAPSHALANYFNEPKQDCKAEVIDIMSATNPLGEMLSNVYNFLLSKSISSAAMYMELAHAFPIDHFPPYNSMGTAHCAELLKNDKPDAIVLICPWISRMVLKGISKCKEYNYGQRSPKIFIIVVDLGEKMTTSWINNQVDHTFVSTKNALDYLSSHGLNIEKSKIFGVPLFKEFAGGAITSDERRIAKDKYKIKNEDTVVTILGGREGVSNTKTILKVLLKASNDYKFIVQCGNNLTLLKKIKWIAKEHKNVLPLGFVESMRELYSLSDIIITKPGAITVSELVVSNARFILDTWPMVMPQEKGNVVFVKKNNLGTISRNIRDIPGLIEKVLDNKSQINDDQKIEKLRNNLYGTQRIGEFILEEVN
jgi:processive 1,2-diacylglycerol beta-glucosyltransferase